MDMKVFSPRQPSKPLSRSTARNSALINQLATPGLGSLLGGRYLAGTGQLLLAIAGFGLLIGWFGLVLLQAYDDMEGRARPQSANWLGVAGAIAFVASWLWALVTSISLLRQARESDPQPPAPPIC